jgi:hypothetical protein
MVRIFLYLSTECDLFDNTADILGVHIEELRGILILRHNYLIP